MSDMQTSRDDRWNTLAEFLEAVAAIESREPVDYGHRNRMILMAMAAATITGVPVGIGHDPAAPDWPVVYFELPVSGQVAFHLPGHERPWDGHSKTQARERIAQYVQANREGTFYVMPGGGVIGPYPEGAERFASLLLEEYKGISLFNPDGSHRTDAEILREITDRRIRERGAWGAARRTPFMNMELIQGQELPELPMDPTGIDAHERYDGPEDRSEEEF